MMNIPSQWLAHIQQLLDTLQEHAYVPYSATPVAALLLLADGSWIPGVRIENASYPLLIPALINALSTWQVHSSQPIQAIALSRAFFPEEKDYVATFPELNPLLPASPSLLVHPEISFASPGQPVMPFQTFPPTTDGFQLARQAAQHAFIPESRFPVGCALKLSENRWLLSANVEHRDWTRGLCAERNALSTARSYGLSTIEAIYLSCPHSKGCTPCGACRQVLIELTPQVPIYLDHDEKHAPLTPEILLPYSFTGKALGKMP